MCGGDLEVTASVGVCQYCGTQQTFPKLDDDRRTNLYDRANHFRRQNDFDKAAGIYESILNEEKTDAEAYWSLVLCEYGVEYVEDPTSRKRIPTCNRTQYTSVLADEDYRQALAYADEHQRIIYEEEAHLIDGIQKSILEVSAKEEPFDIFICYKEADNNGHRTPDSVLAQDMYHQLTNEGYKVFFSRITLEDKIGTTYEAYIFAALQSSKAMVVLGTKAEYFNAVWVKNEWSRYLSLIKGGAKKTLIPAYRDMDAYDLPDEFSHLQAQDMGKLGFMQDLIRGVNKILTTAISQPEATAKDARTTGSHILTPGAAQLLDRASIVLEDGDFESASDYFNRVLDLEPRNAEAYLGKFLALLKMRDEKDLHKHECRLDGYGDFQRALRFSNTDLKKRLNNYNTSVIERLENIQALESTYQQALFIAKNYDPESLLNAASLLDGVSNYKDSENLVTQWRKTSEDLASQKALFVFGGMSWQVLALDGNKVLLITTEIIDERPYDENSEAVEVTWDMCTLRKHLNGAFLKKFSPTEEGQILNVVNENKGNEQHGISGGAKTTDKVFLLSVDDIKKYFSNNETRIAMMGGEVSIWWLRSPGEYPVNATFINEVGEIDYCGECVDFKSGIRPALWRVMG